MPTLQRKTVKSDSDLTLCFGIPGCRALPADFATAVTPALVVACVSNQEDPPSPEDSANTDSNVALCFAIPGGRTSATDFATAAISAVLVASPFLHQENTASRCDTGKNGFCRGAMLRNPRGSKQTERLLWRRLWSSHLLWTQTIQLPLMTLRKPILWNMSDNGNGGASEKRFSADGNNGDADCNVQAMGSGCCRREEVQERDSKHAGSAVEHDAGQTRRLFMLRHRGVTGLVAKFQLPIPVRLCCGRPSAR